MFTVTHAYNKKVQPKELTDSEIVAALEAVCETNPNGENFSNLALAYFKRENYALAASTYLRALPFEPTNSEWKEIYALAKANAHAEVNVTVPEIVYFEKEALLAKPIVHKESLPSTVSAKRENTFATRVRIVTGNVIGVLSSMVMGAVTKLWGRLAGYRDKVWTNWYRRPLFLGILTLAYMREKLNRHNLVSTYPKGVLEGFQEEGQTPPEGVQHFRTSDGSWNNLKNPKEGAAGTRFSRNVKLEAVKPETGKRLLSPNPREISRHLLTRSKQMKEVPFLNMLAAVWIQFQKGYQV